MNYLKFFKKIENFTRLKECEDQYYKTRYEAITLIQKIAQKLYDQEMDKTIYKVYEAILDLTEAVKYRD